MLIELRDIRDEHEIISLLQDDQVRVIRNMGTTIGRKNDQKSQIRYKRLQDEIDDQVIDVANLIKLAARISADLSCARRLLFATADDSRSMKLWRSTRALLLRTRRSTLLTTSRHLAIESSKQGKIILLFTIVTIVFRQSL
jgi:hypothetical protein